MKRRALAPAVLALSLALLPASPARAEAHDAQRGAPFHLVGHALAPVGNLFGAIVVEPFFWIVDNAPFGLFDLD